MSNEEKSHCGFVAIIGRPNVGKSTLLNRLIGEKISITAGKPQTTRHRIMGVSTKGTDQIVYIDTPGIHKNQKKAINRQMNKVARASLADVDCVIVVLEGLNLTHEDYLVLDLAQTVTCPVFVCINKVDRISDKSRLLVHLQSLSQRVPHFKELIPIAAKSGYQVDVLEKCLMQHLPESPHFFPINSKTDRSTEFRLAEVVREKLTRTTGREVPYAIAVEIESLQQEEDRFVVHAIIWIEKDSQKPIVIGKGGEKLKKIGTQARLDMKKILDARVHLQLWVKVRSGWSDNNQALQQLGYVDLDEG